MIDYYKMILGYIKLAKTNQTYNEQLGLENEEQRCKAQIKMLKQIKNKKLDELDNIDFKEEYSRLFKDVVHLYQPLTILFLKLTYPKLTKEDFLDICLQYGINFELVIEQATALNIEMKSEPSSQKQEEQVNSDEKEETDSSYKVGYKHPPQNTRFQKGNKGNPKGRKKKKEQSLMQNFFNELNKKIKVDINGETVIKRKLEFLAMQVSNDIVAGKPMADKKFKLLREINRLMESYKQLGFLDH